jgi:hypothetical protein
METIPTFNYTGHGTEGSKYKETSNLRTCEIAALIRKELKAKYPSYKFSVRSQNFSGGSAIDIDIKKIDFDPIKGAYKKFLQWQEENKEYPFFEDWKFDHQEILTEQEKSEIFGNPSGNNSRYNLKGEELLKEVERIANQYNFNDSDAGIDYFHTAYYLHVNYQN